MPFLVDAFEKNPGKGGSLVHLDQAGAFDRVDHHYLMSVLAQFSLGFGFFRWIIPLYYNIGSNIWINGFLSKPFCIKRSVLQGCPLLPLFYMMALKLLL